MRKHKIAVVIPTIRPESLDEFFAAWKDQFLKYAVDVIVVYDGDNPTLKLFRSTFCSNSGKINFDPFIGIDPKRYTVKEIMGDDADLISNLNSSIRNLGFAFAKQQGYEFVVTLDDDTRPNGDTIGDHIKALHEEMPVSWISTTLVSNKVTDYMRGFPYGIRDEAEVMVSHGVWTGVPDRDAPTQLLAGAYRQVDFYKGPIPKGILFPFCGMNVAFKIQALPYIYYAPVGQFKGAERFDDIWGGIAMKKALDQKGYAVVTGFASVRHERASDPYKNLEREVVGIKENENYWQDKSTHPFFKDFAKKQKRWEKFIKSYDLYDGK